MTKIFLNDMELIGTVFGSRQLIQNAYRDTLTFKFDAEGRSFDALISLFTGVEEIVIEDTKTVTEYGENDEAVTREITESTPYRNYTLPVKRAVEREEVTPETPDSPAVYKDVYIISLAQKTYLETQLENVLRLLQG